MRQKTPHLKNLIHCQAEKYGGRSLIFSRNDATAEWEPVSWHTFSTHTRLIAKGLISLGVKEGEKVGIFSQNLYSHLVADFATYAINGVTVPLYPTASAFQAKFIVEDAGIETMFVGEQAQFDIAVQIFKTSKNLKRIIVMDDAVDTSAIEAAIRFSDLLAQPSGTAYDAEFERRYALQSEDDLLSIIYTSGTTGRPKGVTLHQSNLTEFFKIHRQYFSIIGEDDIVLSFLPLSHIFERAWIYFCLDRGATIYMNHLPSEINEHLKEVRPTAMCAVPRFWEKVYDSIKSRGDSPDYEEIKRQLGIDRGKFFACAGAKLSDSINEFFHSIGVNIAYGYGLTESTASVSCFPAENVNYKIGSVGHIMPGLKVRIADGGEIQLKGATITRGYYNNPEADKAAFTADGWFRTGDCGYIDMEGNLYLTDRIKDLFKTSGGKYIAPQFLEGLVCNDPMVSQAVAIGNERKYVSMLIVPAFAELEKWADEHKISYNGIEDLISHPDVTALYRRIIDHRTGSLARYEQIKRFTLLPREFTVEQGHLTATMKLRRKVINELYADVIQTMYGV